MRARLVDIAKDTVGGYSSDSEHSLTRGVVMADSVYKVIEIVGTSEISWDDAAKKAVERASATLEDLRVAEVTAQDLKIENGKVVAYRTKISLSFKFRDQ